MRSKVAACRLGFSDKGVKLTPIRELLPQADLQHRRPKEQWWTRILPMLRLLANYNEA